MNVEQTHLSDVLVLTPARFEDERGHLFEAFRPDRYAEAGVAPEFLQDTVSVSHKGAIRGLHFQHPTPQGKLVCALGGEIFDVAVDVRRDSPTFGSWVGERLSAQNRRQLWVPDGFAHGFQALTEGAVVLYKSTTPYLPEEQRALLWNDQGIGIAWPLGQAIVSAKDAAATRLAEFDRAVLPVCQQAR